MLTTRRASRWMGITLCCGLAATLGARAQGGAADAALAYVAENQQRLGLTGSDVKEIAVSSVVPGRHSGATHVYLQQQHRGIDVFNGILNVTIGADGTVLAVGNRFVANVAAAAAGQHAQKAAPEAAERAARHLNLPTRGRFEVLDRRAGASEKTVLSSAGVADRPVEAALTWYQTESGRVRLAWKVEIDEASGDHWWQALVDAETGETLGVVDLVNRDTAEALVAATARPAGATSSAFASSSAPASFDPTDGAAYTVFPHPFESPSDGDRALVSNAADPLSSPFGWHDTDGAPGAEFTVTRGNNVHAYTDIDANNVADPGSDPDGGAALLFDFALDLGQNPEHYRPAAVTNLFYWNNIMHDVTYRYGFDEASGNFQTNNYGNGGLGGDYVRAEAQDGSGTNNANFGTGVDGIRPRMQMFVWTNPLPNFVTVTSPAAIAGDYAASRASFGAQLTDVGPISAQVVLSNDGGGASPTDGCEPLVGFPAGAIALVYRGSCEFGLKGLNAQNAGAVAVIVANNAPGAPIVMGPGVSGGAVTIAMVMVTQEHGDLFAANAPLEATLRSNPLTSINRDSDLDAGVIAHEYGHGISNRLTGGPATASCLQSFGGNSEQMGEGWSDWFAMVLTTHPSDTATTPRGVGAYVSFQPADGRGIRPTPYTTDMTVNPSTYASVADPAISQPHGIGYVWNTMLWEMYWNLVDKHGYNADVYGAWDSGGNNLAIQLVMDGMKIQPCQPGFEDGRDAILAADVALTGGANQCEIWRGFARRGLGASADQGLSTNRSDGVAAFDLPASCTAAVFGGFQPPILAAPAINVRDAGATVPVKFTLSGADGAFSLDSQAVDCTTLVPTGEAPSPLDSPGATGLMKRGDSYHVNWKTDADWVGSCRRLTLRLPAASDAVAFFRFE